MQEICQIVPHLPPTISGVGDYAYFLARELRAKHGFDTRFVVCDRGSNAKPEPNDFSVDRIAFSAPRELDQRLGAGKPAAILLHYVGYGYEKRGCPLALLSALESWKKKNPESRLVVMFHELYAFGALWRSSFWTSPLQRWITMRLARIADDCCASYRQSALELERMAPQHAGRISVLPVFSNFGEPTRIRALSSRPRRAAIYSGGFTAGPELRGKQRAIQRLCWDFGIEEAVIFGPVESRLQIGIVTEHKYGYPADAVSDVLNGSRLGIVAYNPRCLAKSGVFASYCAHGVLPVIVSAESADSAEVERGKHYLLAADIDAPLPLQIQQQVANDAFSWYRQHDLSTTARSVAAILSNPNTQTVEVGDWRAAKEAPILASQL